LFMSEYFRSHKAIGSKDKAFIAETAYGIIRWQGLLDYLSEQPATWEKRLEIFQKENLESYLDQEEIPLHIRLSFPKNLFDHIVKTHGKGKAIEICRASNQKAPTTIRVNPLKTTREILLEKWSHHYSVSATHLSPNGITFHKKINFFELQEFKEGLFEVQD